MDQWKWYSDGMLAKDYEDPVQIQFRILLNRAMVNTFALFEYTYDEVIKKYFLDCQCRMIPALVK